MPVTPTELPTPSDQETHHSKNGFNLALVNLMYWLIQSGMKLEIDQESHDNLDKLDEELLKTSAVLYIYHSAVTDALILPIAMRKQLDNLNKMLGPVAISHYQGWQKIYLDLMGYITGTIPLPVIRKKDEAHFSTAQKGKHLEKLVQVSDQYLTLPGSLYGIAPMGTRAKELDSTQVNPSFAKVASSRQLPAIPMAVTHSEGRTQLRVGELISPPSTSEDLNEIVTGYMSQLALLLPTQLRGDYS